MNTSRIVAVVLILGLSLGCGHYTPLLRSAYIEPAGSCGYQVVIGMETTSLTSSDIVFSRCMTLDEAKALADQINRDMEGKWPK